MPRWATKPEWVDGKVHPIESGDHSVVYLRRSLNAAITGTQELLLGSGDGIKAWVNGREVLSKKTKRDGQGRAGESECQPVAGQK